MFCTKTSSFGRVLYCSQFCNTILHLLTAKCIFWLLSLSQTPESASFSTLYLVQTSPNTTNSHFLSIWTKMDKSGSQRKLQLCKTKRINQKNKANDKLKRLPELDRTFCGRQFKNSYTTTMYTMSNKTINKEISKR